MTAKELIQILKRFPKNAQIAVNGSIHLDFNATCDTDNNWVLNLIAVAQSQDNDESENAEQSKKLFTKIQKIL